MTRLFVAAGDRLLRAESREGDDWTAETVLSAVDVDALAVHEDAPSRLFCGTLDEGILRSRDGGDSWKRVGDDAIEHDAVTAVAVDPTDPDVVYAGTEPSRVYRSGDGGDTWDLCEGLTDLPSATQWRYPPRPQTHHVRWIEADPHEPETIHVSIEAGALVRSLDGGDTWEDRVPSSRRDVHSLATHADAPHRVWAAAGDGYAESSDGGDTWDHPESGLDVRYCWSVAVDPGDPETVLVSAASGPWTAHRPARAESFVFRRRDGNDWERIDGGLPQGVGVSRYELEPGFEVGECFAASNAGCFRTADAGDSWEAVPIEWPEPLESRTVAALAALP